ncbi:MAG: LemA family protein [Paludibacteraceae bacterium]
MKRNVFYLLLLVVAMSLQSCNYNALVEQEESVDKAWAEVENQYQRRMDLVPSLVGVVEGYAKHENATLTSVIEARSRAASITLQADELNEETLAKFQAAQDELSRGLGRLMAVAESYPELKANENFIALQDQLEGTENRITVARRNFNDAAQSFNAAIRKFPTVIYAGWFGFEKRAYFKAASGAEVAPRVQFDF